MMVSRVPIFENHHRSKGQYSDNLEIPEALRESVRPCSSKDQHALHPLWFICHGIDVHIYSFHV